MASDVLENSIVNSDYRILIVDDVMSNVLLLKILLNNVKFQVITARDGFECLKKAHEEHPDIILLDVMMPVMSGIQTAEKLKGDDDTKDIPIIFLTALNSSSDVVQGFKAGASDFITKPFNKEELLVRVRHQIALVAAQRTIKRQNDELKRTIANRDRMYSVIAHDLRSPIGTVKMVIDMLGLQLTPDIIGDENAELIRQADKEVDQVHTLLDNLLKWTKSQTGRLQVAAVDFDIDENILGVIEVFNIVADVKHITLEYVERSHIDIHADPDLFNTIMRNFLSNAIKFSNEGGKIEVSCTREGDYAKVSIRDHGVGIKEENLIKLFDTHTAYSTDGTYNEKGSGLGLLLCKDFAVKNGGDVYVESKEGEGSTFSFTVPVVKEGTEDNKEIIG